MFDVSASFDYAFDKTIFKNKYELPAKESLYDILGVWESQTTLWAKLTWVEETQNPTKYNMCSLPEFNQITHLTVNSLKLQVNQKMAQRNGTFSIKTKNLYLFDSLNI